jgi:CIC family chloride channel protein
MIAAATGALVSNRIGRSTLNFRQQQVFDYHKIPFIFSWNINWFSCQFTIPIFSRTELFSQT